MKKCTRCGFDNYDEAYLCRKCGSKLKKKKNKSLDLDIQNSSYPSKEFEHQPYQGQTYDPYAQQQYQQQYQSNQPYYDPYQGQQFYDPYQAQQYQGQQYQQAQSQNRGNADFGNDNGYNSYGDNPYPNDYQQYPQSQNRGNTDFGNDNGYNSFGDNLYPNDYDGSQSDFTNQSDYYNNYSGTGYNDSFNNDYNNDYNGSADNSFGNNDYNSTADNSFGNNDYNSNSSVDKNNSSDNSSADKQQNAENSIPHQPHQPPFDKSTATPHVSFSTNHDGNRHSFTVTTSHVKKVNGMPGEPASFGESFGEFANIFANHMAQNSEQLEQLSKSDNIADKAFYKFANVVTDYANQNNAHMHTNNAPLNAGDFIRNEYHKSPVSTSIERHKPKAFLIIAIIAILVITSTIIPICACFIYSKYNSENTNTKPAVTISTEPTEPKFSIDNLPKLPMKSSPYTISAENDNSISVQFQLPVQYSIIADDLSESNISFKKDNYDDSSTLILDASISLNNSLFRDELETLEDTIKAIPENEYEKYVVNTELGEMSYISAFGRCYGVIQLDSDNCLYITSRSFDSKYDSEAEAIIISVAETCKKI